MKFLKTTLALALGVSILCGTAVFSNIPASAKAVSEVSYATSANENSVEWENTFTASSNAIYQKSRREIYEDNIPGMIKQYVSVTFKNYGFVGSDCVDDIRRSSILRQMPTPPAVDGFVFDGWYIDRNFLSKFELSRDGATISFNRTFYAKWVNVKADKYNKLNVLVKRSDSYNYTSETILIAKDTTVKLPDLHKAGYKFVGWRYDNGVTPIEGEISVKNNLYIYAYFEKIPEYYEKIYKVAYHVSASEADTYMSDEMTGDTVINSAPDVQPIDNMQFDGWYFDSEFTKPAFVDGNGIVLADYADEAHVVHLYAKWTEIVAEKVNIYLYTNYDVQDNTTFDVMTITNGDVIYSLPTPTREGYTFGGWYLDREATQPFVIASTGKTIIANTMLYAKWTKNVETKVSAVFYNNYSSDDNEIFNTISITLGERLNVVPIPTRVGYTFAGWYLDRNGTTPFVVPAGGYMLNEDISLYAKWNKISEEVEICYYSNYSETDNSVLMVEAKKQGEKITSLPTKVVREGYIFAGWYLDRNGTTPFVIPAGGYVLNEDISLYVKWNKKVDERVTITLYRNYTADEMVQYNPQRIVKGEKIYSLFTPTRRDYTFGGWYIDRACTVSFVIPAEGKTIDEDIVLYAKWIGNDLPKVVTLTKVIPQIDGSNFISKATMARGCVLPKLGTCQSTGRTFVGWYFDQEYTQPVDFKNGFTVNEDMTIYAKFINIPAGDINKDGLVNQYDLLTLKSYIKDKVALSRDDAAIADLNYDGQVDRFDLHALNIYLNLVNELYTNFLPALNLTKDKLDLVEDGNIDAKDLNYYFNTRVVIDAKDPAYDFSKYNYDYDFNFDASVDEIDAAILRLVLLYDRDFINLE